MNEFCKDCKYWQNGCTKCKPVKRREPVHHEDNDIREIWNVWIKTLMDKIGI